MKTILQVLSLTGMVMLIVLGGMQFLKATDKTDYSDNTSQIEAYSEYVEQSPELKVEKTPDTTVGEVEKSVLQDTTEQTNQIVQEGSNYKLWVGDKKCWDESNFPIFQEVPYDESLNGAYDPNWLVGTPKDDGCTYYMHPGQGHFNNPPDERN